MDITHPSERFVYTVPTGGDVRSELLTMREWRLCLEEETSRLILTSLNGQQIWQGPVFESPWSPDQPAGPSTGVHGLKQSARRFYWNEGWFFGEKTWAWGWVALSGLVEENAGGFRAERAVIRRLRLGPRTLALFAGREEVARPVADLEDRYQCPVKIGYPEWRLSRLLRAKAGR